LVDLLEFLFSSHRNPIRDPEGTWCYTTRKSKRWEHCDIPKCRKSFRLIFWVIFFEWHCTFFFIQAENIKQSLKCATVSVANAENFWGGPSFVTIVWRHKSTLGEVPKARPF